MPPEALMCESESCKQRMIEHSCSGVQHTFTSAEQALYAGLSALDATGPSGAERVSISRHVSSALLSIGQAAAAMRVYQSKFELEDNNQPDEPYEL